MCRSPPIHKSPAPRVATCSRISASWRSEKNRGCTSPITTTSYGRTSSAVCGKREIGESPSCTKSRSASTSRIDESIDSSRVSIDTKNRYSHRAVPSTYSTLIGRSTMVSDTDSWLLLSVISLSGRLDNNGSGSTPGAERVGPMYSTSTRRFRSPASSLRASNNSGLPKPASSRVCSSRTSSV